MERDNRSGGQAGSSSRSQDSHFPRIPRQVHAHPYKPHAHLGQLTRQYQSRGGVGTTHYRAPLGEHQRYQYQPSYRHDPRTRFQGEDVDFRPGRYDENLQYASPIYPPPKHLSHIATLKSREDAVESGPASEIDTENESELGIDRGDIVLDAKSPNSRNPLAGPVPRITRDNKAGRAMATHESSERTNAIPARPPATRPSQDQVATMEALSAAIQQGLNTTNTTTFEALPRRPSADALALRMPFQGEPGSPTSVYTDATGSHRPRSIAFAHQSYDQQDSRPSTIAEQDMDDYERTRSAQGPLTPMSQVSAAPIIAKDVSRISSRVPESRRQLRLDIGSVREAEARGSLTSLSDLIKRATKLASNLDRGRTASRFGELDMFSSSEKANRQKLRNSTYSDVLAAFPPPADGSSTPGRNRPMTTWPNGEKDSTAYNRPEAHLTGSQDKTAPTRKCCGLSPRAFVPVLIVIILLIVAAVLIPVFLILLPKQHHKLTAKDCLSSHTCQNGGVSTFFNDICSCICLDGFTGSDCSTEQDPDCSTISFTDDGKTFQNATIGSGVLPVLGNSSTSFDILLNTTNLLSTFSFNNLSCASQNSLIGFGLSNSAKPRRSVMDTNPNARTYRQPVTISKRFGRVVAVDELHPVEERLRVTSPHALYLRQDTTQSTNGIVFASSTTIGAAPTPTASTGSMSQSNSSSTPGSLQTGSRNATDRQINFAATVVLFVLDSTQEINVAVAANQALTSYFNAINSANHTVEVVGGSQRINADFDKFQIKLANGTLIGKPG